MEIAAIFGRRAYYSKDYRALEILFAGLVRRRGAETERLRELVQRRCARLGIPYDQLSPEPRNAFGKATLTEISRLTFADRYRTETSQLNSFRYLGRLADRIGPQGTCEACPQLVQKVSTLILKALTLSGGRQSLGIV